MSHPLSLRLPDPTLDRLGDRARRVQLPPRTLAQRYIDEGLRQDDHPGIRFADGPAGRRAVLVGGGDVWEVVAVVRDNDGDVAAAADYLGIEAERVQAAVAYYAEFRDEIDAWIDANERETAAAHARWQAAQAAFNR